jgi:LysM repeat protein
MADRDGDWGVMKIFNLFVAISVTATVAQAQQQYTVQPGDSLGQIAIRELGDSGAWRDMCEINFLANCDRILTGQVLQLPSRPRLITETHETSGTEAEPAEPITAAETPEPVSTATSVQNIVRNSRLSGAVAGIVGQGGALPEGWGIGGFQGAEIVQTGIEEGLPFIDLRFTGAPIGNAIFVNFVTTENSDEVEQGQTWTSSAFVHRIDGSMDNIDNIFLRLQEFAGSDGKGSSGTNITPYLDVRTRATATREISDTSSDRLISFFRIGVSRGDIDLTLRISGPQLELSANAG